MTKRKMECIKQPRWRTEEREREQEHERGVKEIGRNFDG